MTTNVPNHILVFVPGYMGSLLKDPQSGATLWLDPGSILRLGLDEWFKRMTYPNPLEPVGVMNDIIFVPPWVKQEEYGRFFKALRGMGYRVDGDEREINVYRFAYDWRQDNRISARQLGAAIERWRGFHLGAQVWIIAHSNGGVVARWYVEKEGGKDVVQRLLLMGSPYDGTPKVMRIAWNGADMLMRPGLDPLGIAARTRTLFRTFPSLYQLMPVQNRFLRGVDDVDVDAFDGLPWLDDPQQREYLLDGQRFTRELGDAASVETLCFFGRKKPTLTSGLVRRAAQGKWDSIEWKDTEAGDGTIPERSAAHPNATGRFPFVVSHGDIYVDPAVLEFLRWELVDKFGDVEKVLVATATMSLNFTPDKDAYREQETIWLRATVTDPQDQPLNDTVVVVRIAYDRPLPGDPTPQIVPEPITVKLVPMARAPGKFEGLLYGPSVDGYYRLTAQAQHPDAGLATAEELIAVETVETVETAG
jgi:pimeloyl-ACP methyl ester carboxylesterase